MGSFQAKEADEIWRSGIVAFIENRTSQFFGFRQSFLAKGLSEKAIREMAENRDYNSTCNAFAWKILGDSIRAKWPTISPKQQDAANALRKATESDPDYTLAYNNLASSVSGLSETERLEVINKGQKLDENFDFLVLRMADTLKDKSKGEYLAEQLKRFPSHPRMVISKVKAQYAVSSQLTTELLAELEIAIKSKPLAYWPRNYLGSLLLSENKYEDALSYLNEAIAVDPLLSSAYFNAANCYYQLGDPEKSEAVLRQGFAKGVVEVNPSTQVGIIFLSNEDSAGAFSYFEKGAREGDPIAMIHLGHFYLKDHDEDWEKKYAGVKEADPRKAIKWYENAAKAGNAEAKRFIAHAFRKGWHPLAAGEDYKQAFPYFEDAAENEDINAMIWVAAYYDPDFASDLRYRLAGIDPNGETAFLWYQRAANKYETFSMSRIGYAYANGWHPDLKQGATDYKSALEWFERAAQFGNADAQREVGHYYSPEKWASERNALVGGVNKVKAIELYKKSSSMGDGKASAYIGVAFRNGWHPDGGLNLDEAMKWFEKGAQQGNAFSNRELGAYYAPIDSEFYRVRNAIVGGADPEEAKLLFERAAEIGDVWAIENLRKMNILSAAEAFSRLEEIATKDNADAMFLVGSAFRDGWHPSGEDYQQAFTWFQRGAVNGEKDSMAGLGDFYRPREESQQRQSKYRAVIPDPDREEAIKWYYAAAAKGESYAMEMIGLAFQEGWHPNADGRDYANAYSHFLDAAQAGNSDAMYRVGHYFLPDWPDDWMLSYKGIKEPSSDEAIKWYERARSSGQVSATVLIAFAFKQGWHPDAGGKPDYKRAFPYFKEGAEAGDSNAMRNMGHYFALWDDEWAKPYRNATGKLVSARDSVSWYENASSKGDIESKRMMAWSFIEGWHPDAGGKPDYVKAFNWFVDAAESGDCSSMVQLGHYYRPRDESWEEPYEGIQAVDLTKAISWYEKAGSAGYGHGCRRVGEAYLEGWHPEGKDLAEAKKWLRKAVALGDQKASGMLQDLTIRALELR